MKQHTEGQTKIKMKIKIKIKIHINKKNKIRKKIVILNLMKMILNNVMVK